MDSKVKVLWISDIHFSGAYSDFEKKMGNFFLLPEIKDVDYVIVSGDLVNRANNENYADFNLFLSKIKEMNNKNAKILIVPGNHDVERDFKKKKNEFISAVTDKSSNDRNDFLVDNNYREYFEGIFRRFSSFSNNFLPKSYVRSKDGTCGYFLDKKNKLLFVMLNSAWFSLGKTFLEQYLRELDEKSINYEEVEMMLSGVGKQMVGLDSINKRFAKDLIDVIEAYPEYLMVTTMHHPPHWLHEQQRFEEDKNPNLHKVFLLTDLLLTGHEHAPLSIENQLLSENTHYFQGGCFYENDEFDWFSVLEINTVKRSVKQTKIKYDENKWVKLRSQRTEQFDKKHFIILDKDRINETYQVLSKDFEKIIKIIIRQKGIEGKIIENNEFFVALKTKDDLYIFIKDFNIGKVIKFLNCIIFEEEIVKTRIKFRFFDLLHKHGKNIYSKEGRMSAPTTISRYFDFHFDLMRQNFFSVLDENQVEIIKNTKFVSKIYPFWDIEKYID